jgi:hypothetical protein
MCRSVCKNRKSKKKFPVSFSSPSQSFAEIEKDLLNGQKLQGTLTGIYRILIVSVHPFSSSGRSLYGFSREKLDPKVEKRKRFFLHLVDLNRFPLFTTVYEVAFKGLPPSDFLHRLSKSGLL